MCCVGAYGKRKENMGVALGTYRKQTENMCFARVPIENVRKTQVLRKNLLKTQRQHTFYIGTLENATNKKCCVGTYGKRKENTHVAREPMENDNKTNALHSNLWKTQ